MKQKLLKPLNWLKKSSKKQLISLVIGVLVLLGLGYMIFGGGTQETIVQASRGAIEEEVLVTGKTESKTTVNLGFERSGKVVSSPFDVGSSVVEGQIIAALDQSELNANLQKADANLNQAQIELDTITRTSSLSNNTAQNTLLTTIKDSYIKSDNAIRNGVDQFFKNPRGFNAEFDPSFTDSGTTYYGGISDTVKRDISSDRVNIESILVAWDSSIKSPNFGKDIQTDSDKAEKNLEKVGAFLDKVASIINSLPTTAYQYNSTIQGYKTTVASARTEVVNVNSDLINAEDKYNNAPKVSGGTAFEDVRIQQAKIDSLMADRAAITADLSKTIIRSPISGIVTKMEAKRGEIVTSGTPLVTVISNQKLQVEANVSEVNISKVAVGNNVSMSFDAIPNQAFEGKVIYIDPAAVLVDGVATYKITVAFNDEAVTGSESTVRSGLTVNLKIQTKKLDDRVKVPAYAVEKRGEKSYVKVMKGDKAEEVEVVTGIRGKDGSIEITSGLDGAESLVVTQTL